MKFRSNLATFRSSFSAAASACPRGTSKPLAMRSVKVDRASDCDLILSATDGEVSLSVPAGATFIDGGDSFLVPHDFMKGVLSSAKGDEIALARCDLDLCNSFKRTMFNFDVHRQPQAYGLIVERKGQTLMADGTPVRSDK